MPAVLERRGGVVKLVVILFKIELQAFAARKIVVERGCRAGDIVASGPQPPWASGRLDLPPEFGCVGIAWKSALEVARPRPRRPARRCGFR